MSHDSMHATCFTANHLLFLQEKALHSKMTKHKLDVQDIPSESKKLLEIKNVSDRIAAREVVSICVAGAPDL
jgi:hypothetical protein